jgi:hypothetical protein
VASAVFEALKMVSEMVVNVLKVTGPKLVVVVAVEWLSESVVTIPNHVS